MESVKYEQNYNPEAITNYYSCGVQPGRSNKDLILKAKQHLSAIGWSFSYIFKNSGRRELRYRSPAGRIYCSLRTACQDLILHQGHYNHDVEIDSSKIEEINEPEEKLEKNEECNSSYNRPKKRIRIQDVEASFEQQQRERSLVINNENFEGKRVQDLKRTMESSKKRIQKVEAASTRRNRCVLSLLIERNIVLRGSRVVYRNKKDEILARGKIYDEGIQCDCCGGLFLLSKFEAHAGSTYHRPAANIFLDDGRSLFDCQTELRHETQDTNKEYSHSGIVNDDFCCFCSDGGELLCCDSCTSSFHSTCIGLNEIPDSAYWFCPSCCCRICHQGDQISKSLKEDSHDHGKFKCRQCECHFHIDCITRSGFSVSTTDSLKCFCSVNCEQIYSGLMRISGRMIPLTMNNLSWSLLKLDYTDGHDTYECTETYSKLKVALDVMHECFQPIKHRWSEKDLVEDVIFSRSTKRSNFKGFFTAVLERDDEMITVVTLRIHGCKAAEIPLIGTRFRYRRLGMCRILMDELERKLGELGVERLVLAAVPETINTWIEAFGFSVMMETERLDLVECKFLGFPGTIICQKILKKM